MVSSVKLKACVLTYSDLETLLRVLWMWSHLLMIPPVLAILAFDFLVLRRLADLDLDKRSLEWAPS
jgi:hypothetical protein